MSNIENELRRLGESVRNQGSGAGGLTPRQRRRIKLRRALFAAGGAVTAIALVATASYGVGLVRDQRDIAPAEDASSTLIRFERSGGFTWNHHVLTIKRDGSALLESPGSRGLVEPMEFDLDADVMATVQDAVDQVDWARLNEQRTLTNVRVADGYLIQMSHDGYNVIIEGAAEPRSVEPLIDVLSGIIEERLNESLAAEPSVTLSETTVRPGDVVDLAIRARSSYMWGVLTSLEAQRAGGWRWAGYWRTWIGRGPRVLKAIRTRAGAIEDIGFSGSAGFKLEIPQLDPGIYRITKEFISEGTAPVEERRIVAEVRFEVVAEERSTSEQDFSAIWPEDNYDEAKATCGRAAEEDDSEDPEGENIVSFRQDPASIVLEFGDEVLGWRGTTARAIAATSGQEQVYVLREAANDQAGKRGGAVRVIPVEVLPGCWSLGWVSQMPDEQPNDDGSMVVRDRDVMMGFDLGAASSAIFEVGYGGKSTRHLWTRGEQEGVEFRLDFEPQGTGHFLVLLRDEQGQVFSAFGSPLPEGDFAAG